MTQDDAGSAPMLGSVANDWSPTSDCDVPLAISLANALYAVSALRHGLLTPARFREVVAATIYESLRKNKATNSSTNWISVKDRLPEDDESYLVCDLVTGEYLPDRGFIEDGVWHIFGDPEFQVTHWMPFPPPPEEAKEKP
jgi:hypothetical protein